MPKQYSYKRLNFDTYKTTDAIQNVINDYCKDYDFTVHSIERTAESIWVLFERDEPDLTPIELSPEEMI